MAWPMIFETMLLDKKPVKKGFEMSKRGLKCTLKKQIETFLYIKQYCNLYNKSG